MKGNENRTYKLTPRNLTDAEAQKRLDLYSEQGDEKQFFSIQKIKKRYLEKNRAELDKRAKSDLFFAHGIRAGLPHSSHETIKYAREETDQDFRNNIVEEAKGEYRRHQNLSKWFKSSDSKQTDEAKDIEQDKRNLGKFFTQPQSSKSEMREAFKSVKNKDMSKDI